MLYYNIKFIYIGVHMHSEHRKRLKGRFLREGLEHFEPHNVLELLLFYSIPQQATALRTKSKYSQHTKRKIYTSFRQRAY